MKLTLFRAPSLVGIDVQPEGLRIAHLRHLKSNYSIEYATMHPLPDDLFMDGKIKRWDILQTILTEIVCEAGLTGMAAAISLPANLVRMRQIEVPAQFPETHIPAEILAHIQRELPGMTEELSIDYSIKTSTKECANLFFAAARKEYLMHYANCIDGAKLKLKIADVDIYALLRIVLLDVHLQAAPTETNAIIYITGQRVIFILYQMDEISFHQCWDISSTDDLETQIKHKIQLFLAGFQQINLQRIVYCHTSFQYPSLIEYLETSLRVQIYVVDVMSKFTCVTEDIAELMKTHANEFLLACGLGLYKVPAW